MPASPSGTVGLASPVTAPVPTDLLTALPAAPRARRLLGVRVRALAEIAVAYVVLAVVEHVWVGPAGFAAVRPHPYWLVVLLAASYYGTREALVAVVLGTVLHLVSLGGQGALAQSWLTGLALPMGWGLAALVFGEIRDATRRRNEGLRDDLGELRRYVRSLHQRHEALQQDNQELERRVASQLLTVQAMYQATRAIERPDEGGVLQGVGELVRTVLAPQKFSLFLLDGGRLEACISEGWAPEDNYATEIGADVPLHRAIVRERRQLAVVRAGDEALLRDQGVLAGPVVDDDTDQIIGMLKIEAIRFLDLHPTNLQNFRVVCDWIGSALARARRIEHDAELLRSQPMPLDVDLADFRRSATLMGALSATDEHLP